MFAAQQSQQRRSSSRVQRERACNASDQEKRRGNRHLEAKPLQLQIDAVGLVSTRGLTVANEAVERAARRERHR